MTLVVCPCTFPTWNTGQTASVLAVVTLSPPVFHKPSGETTARIQAVKRGVHVFIQLDPAYWRHPKTLRLIRLLGPNSDVIMPRLWSWAFEFARNGVLSASDVEIGSGWVADAGKLVKSLLETGFLDSHGDSYILHGWERSTGAFLERYDAKLERQRNEYAEKKRNSRKSEESGILPEESQKNAGRKPDTIRIAPPSSAADEVRRQLMQRADQAKINAKPDTLLRYLDGWIARIGAGKVEEWLMKPSSVGLSVTELHDLMFPKQPQKRPVETINGMNGTAKCGTCNDTGKVAGYKDGALTMDAPCSCLRRKVAK